MYTQALPPLTHKLAARSIANVPSLTTDRQFFGDWTLQVRRALDDGQSAELRFFYEKDREPLS
ncbi:hypothetical protein ALC60_12600 [Trachymyrmex zeteki]|uniref:Uncharacterized protein n=1 Tax=Mycetomoellerius zeteki TaxID=64791 RepID=A0A151WK80_9HYME|nr:hypothetical protein ALC60_12600 [Trachymyrmex zeteki]